MVTVASCRLPAASRFHYSAAGSCFVTVLCVAHVTKYARTRKSRDVSAASSGLFHAFLVDKPKCVYMHAAKSSRWCQLDPESRGSAHALRFASLTTLTSGRRCVRVLTSALSPARGPR